MSKLGLGIGGITSKNTARSTGEG